MNPPATNRTVKAASKKQNVDRDKLDSVRDHIASCVIGQQRLVEGMLVCLLSDGHLLVEGLPGLAKTTEAPGVGVPSGRITLPETVPVLTACDHAGLVPSNRTSPRTKTPNQRTALPFIVPPFQILKTTDRTLYKDKMR